MPTVLAQFDKGNYTCIVQNHHTNMSRMFVLDITGMNEFCLFIHVRTCVYNINCDWKNDFIDFTWYDN